MRIGALARALILETHRRRPSDAPADKRAKARAVAYAEQLREWMYPKQRAFFAREKGKPRVRWRATCKTRRAGATAGGVRELVARAIEQPGFRATYTSKTNVDARDRAWTNDNKSGFLDLLRDKGTRLRLKGHHRETYDIGGVRCRVSDQRMKLDFSNGSQVEVFGANNISRQSSKRGAAKHVFWIDEAQDFPGLDDFVAVISPAIRDFGGEVWLTGTPGRDAMGLFYEVTKEEAEGDARPFGWEVHTIAVVDNPMFGHVVIEAKDDQGAELAYYVHDNLYDSPELKDEQHLHRWGPFSTVEEAEARSVEVRWEVTAGAEIAEKQLNGDEPDFVREWLGRWVKADARYVYPVHSVPRHQLLFAPQRLTENPFVGSAPRFADHPRWYDHVAAVRDLPRLGRDRRPHQWLFAIGVDFGYWPDPFALVVWAFSPTSDHVYEMFSWKQTRVATDDQGEYIKRLWDAIDNVVLLVGDPAGKQDDFDLWRRRMNLPIEEANKRGKNTLEEFLAGDVRRGRVHLREGSPLYHEMLNLVYLPTKPGKTREVHKHRKVGNVVHGDHAADAARYSYSALTHYLSDLGTERPTPGSRQALVDEEERIEKQIEDRDQRREELLAEQDELVAEYGSHEHYDGY